MKHEGSKFIQRLLADDPEAEGQFFADYSPLVQKVALTAGLSMEDAEEVSQEALMGALLSIRTKQGLEDPRKLGAFVYGTARNVIAQYRRYSVKQMQVLEGAGRAQAESARQGDCSPERQLWNEEFRQQCCQVLDSLHSRYREFLNDYYIRGLDAKAFCRKSGISPGNCRVLHHRALKAFSSKAEQLGILTELLGMMQKRPD